MRMANYYEIQTYGEGHEKDFTFYLESANPLTNEQVVEGLRESYLGVDGLEEHHLDNVVAILPITEQEFTDGCGVEATKSDNPVEKPSVFRMVAFERERLSENWRRTDYFLADESVSIPIKAMRAAVAEFLTTEDGEESIEDTMGDFNWGDAMEYVPDDIWSKHGLRIKYANEPYLISGSVLEVTVDQDERLAS